jgi:hypothetical protein
VLYEELVKELEKEIESIKNSLAYGAASDYPSYCQSVGTVSGIEKSIGIIKDYLNKYIEEE